MEEDSDLNPNTWSVLLYINVASIWVFCVPYARSKSSKHARFFSPSIFLTIYILFIFSAYGMKRSEGHARESNSTLHHLYWVSTWEFWVSSIFLYEDTSTYSVLTRKIRLFFKHTMNLLTCGTVHNLDFMRQQNFTHCYFKFDGKYTILYKYTCNFFILQ